MKAPPKDGPPYKVIAGATLAMGVPAIFEWLMLGPWITLGLNAMAGAMVLIALRTRERAWQREMAARRR